MDEFFKIVVRWNNEITYGESWTDWQWIFVPNCECNPWFDKLILKDHRYENYYSAREWLSLFDYKIHLVWMTPFDNGQNLPYDSLQQHSFAEYCQNHVRLHKLKDKIEGIINSGTSHLIDIKEQMTGNWEYHNAEDVLDWLMYTKPTLQFIQSIAEKRNEYGLDREILNIDLGGPSYTKNK